MDGLDDVPGHNFEQDLDFYQLARFSSPLNVDLVIGNRARPSWENTGSYQLIRDEVAKHHMPLVILRISRMLQHVLLVKSVSQPDSSGNVSMVVYDSNFPEQDNTLIYSTTDQEFYAPDVISLLVDDSQSAVGIFVVDQGDMNSIENLLVNYYSDRCTQAATAKH
jgi:hypothetical protein